IYYAIDRLCLPRYEAVICVSADLQARCLDCKVPAERCLLIENGIDTNQYTRWLTIEEAKRQLGLPPQRLLIGAVGRLSPEKGFDLLIRAADQLVRGGIDLELWIAGEGDEKDHLQALITKLAQGDRIRLLGYRSDTATLYQALDLFALS